MITLMSEQDSDVMPSYHGSASSQVQGNFNQEMKRTPLDFNPGNTMIKLYRKRNSFVNVFI